MVVFFKRETAYLESYLVAGTRAFQGRSPDEKPEMHDFSPVLGLLLERERLEQWR
jgi:hypothetical protein